MVQPPSASVGYSSMVPFLHLLLKSSIVLFSKFRKVSAQLEPRTLSIGRSTGQLDGLAVLARHWSLVLYTIPGRILHSDNCPNQAKTELESQFFRHSFSYISSLIVSVETKHLDFRPQLHMTCQIKYFFGNLDTSLSENGQQQRAFPLCIKARPVQNYCRRKFLQKN